MSTKPPTCEPDTRFVIYVYLILLFFAFVDFIANKSKNPIPNIPVKYVTFTVESTAVKYYNLTLDGRLQSIVGLGIRASNPDRYGRTLHLNGLIVEVWKGVDHELAYGALPDFTLTPGSEERLHVEALGLVYLARLPKEIAKEVIADVAAGLGIVNVVFSGRLGRHDLEVTCDGVGIDSSRSAARVQEVDCQVRVDGI